MGHHVSSWCHHVSSWRDFLSSWTKIVAQESNRTTTRAALLFCFSTVFWDIWALFLCRFEGFEAHQPYRACLGCDAMIIQVFWLFRWVLFCPPYTLRNARYPDLSIREPSRMSWAAERSVAAQDPWNWALLKWKLEEYRPVTGKPQCKQRPLRNFKAPLRGYTIQTWADLSI